MLTNYSIFKKIINFTKKIMGRDKRSLFLKKLSMDNPTLIFCSDICITVSDKINFGKHVIIDQKAYLASNGGITIGDYSQLAVGVTIFSDDHLYDIGDTIPISNKKVDKPVVIENFCIIGANVSILPGVRIGEGSIIGMGSVVTTNIASLSIVMGNPARVIKMRGKEEFLKLKSDQKYFTIVKGKEN